ncbi:MAG: hypothetical protein KatS3mg010_0347 [Acidimicrobiia bacterium]|nr:MAG: hypothetical protein KatS3mg010_0347 [Acidimicrobiia bacterium]
MNDSPLVSVVMPAFNEAEILETSLADVVEGPARPRLRLRGDRLRERVDRRHARTRP